MESLRKARANEFLAKWKKHHLIVTKWITTCNDVVQSQTGDPVNLATVRERLDEIDVSD